MDNLYQILGVSENASSGAIRVAYLKQARKHHPDKGGNNEQMNRLTSAYRILSDPITRREFDQQLGLEESRTETSGDLPAAGVAFSKTFREQHRQFYNQYRENPLEKRNALPTCSNYDLFSSIAAKKDLETKFDFDLLTPEKAVEHFINFLQGNYFGSGLRDLSREFYKIIKQPETQLSSEFQLYCGIYEILLVAVKEKEPKILSSLQKITDYAKRTADQSIEFIAPLLYSKHFRDLFSYAVNYYWSSEESILETDAFNGEKATEKLVENLKSKLSGLKSLDSKAMKLLRLARLLLKLEKDINRSPDKDELASFYRKKAFHLLDWIPSLTHAADKTIIVNTLLQIGITLQKAAQRAAIQGQEHAIAEKMNRMCMADEKLAAIVLCNAVALSRHTTPDVELYTCMHSVKCLMSCHYNDSELEVIIKAFQERALWLADLFPFVQGPQSNVNLITKEDQDLVLMRQLLHALINKIDEIDHDRTKVFYQAFEACLRNWYQKNYDPETEKKLRKQLMQELLDAKKWQAADLENNLNTPFLSSDLDKHGWSASESVLQLARKDGITTYKTVHGFGINEKSGEIAFVFEECKADEADHNHMLTVFDLEELFKLDVTSAIFSLDPANPDMPYNPFNQMRFAPSTLYQSQLLHTMLLTDYMLKFLTVGQEVQRTNPFNLRSLDEMTSRLPAHLKKIISDFHESYQEESMSRFWIESEGVELVIDDKEDSKTRISGCDTFFALGDIKMVVRHHKLERDAEGNLVDKDGENEGWDCYILTPEQKKELDAGERIISGSALIIVEGSSEIIFWENNRLTYRLTQPLDADTLSELSKRNRNTEGKIDVIEDLESRRQVYRFVLKATEKANLPHRYTPEFIFAQEFSKHYDEFAVYFPEFGRLRELSKAVAMVNIMHKHRDTNKEKAKKIEGLLKDESYWQEKRNEITPSVRPQVAGHFLNLCFLHKGQSLRQASDIVSDLKQQTALYTSYDKKKTNLLSSFRHQLGSQADWIIEQFLDGNDSPLLSGLLNHYKLKVDKQLVMEARKSYPGHTEATLIGALTCNQDDTDKVVNSKTASEVEKVIEANKKYLNEELVKCQKLEKSFEILGFASRKKEVDLKDKCLWVPASLHHDVASGRSRTVYGGVQISPKVLFLDSLDPMRLQILERQKKPSAIRLAANNLCGQTYNNFIAALVRQKYSDPKYIVSQNHYVPTPDGPRYLDVAVVLASNPKGSIIEAFEIKTGCSPYDGTSQEKKDRYISEAKMSGKPVKLIRFDGKSELEKQLFDSLPPAVAIWQSTQDLLQRKKSGFYSWQQSENECTEEARTEPPATLLHDLRPAEPIIGIRILDRCVTALRNLLNR